MNLIKKEPLEHQTTHMLKMLSLCSFFHHHHHQSPYQHHHKSPLFNAFEVDGIVLHFLLDVFDLVNLDPGQAPID